MTLGTGIFSASIIFGTLFLYLKTRGIWNWHKITKVFTLTVLTLAILTGLAFWSYFYFENKPQKLTDLWDIPLSASKNDLIFLKGTNYISEESSWQFSEESDSHPYTYLVIFLKDKIHAILYFTGDTRHAPEVNGVFLGDSLNTMVKKLGRNFYVQISKDQTTRIYSYPQYNSVYILEKNKVISLGVYNSDLDEIEFEQE